MVCEFRQDSGSRTRGCQRAIGRRRRGERRCRKVGPCSCFLRSCCYPWLVRAAHAEVVSHGVSCVGTLIARCGIAYHALSESLHHG